MVGLQECNEQSFLQFDVDTAAQWELPSCRNAVVQYRATKNERMVSDGQLIALNARLKGQSA